MKHKPASSLVSAPFKYLQMVFIFLFSCHLASVTLYLFKLSTLGRAHSAKFYSQLHLCNFGVSSWTLIDFAFTPAKYRVKDESQIQVTAKWKLGRQSKLTPHPMDPRLHKVGVFCCIPSHCSKDSEDVVNCQLPSETCRYLPRLFWEVQTWHITTC